MMYALIRLAKPVLSVATLTLLLFVTSCDDDNDEPSGPPTVTVDKISAHLDFNFTATGKILLTVRDADSEDVVTTAETSIEGFTDAQDGWIDFAISPAAELEELKTYRIELVRSKPNVPYNDVVLWNSASDDVYEHGDPGAVGATAPDGDFSFRVYVDGVLDQKQEATTDISLMSNDRTFTQEFMLGH